MSDGVLPGAQAGPAHWERIAEHPYVPHPMALFRDTVADIRPADARSYFHRAGAPEPLLTGDDLLAS